MPLAAFRALASQFVVISGITAGAALVAWLVGGSQALNDTLAIGIARMKGPWVWTFGFGLASFVVRRGRALPLDIQGIFQPSEAVAKVTSRIDRASRHRYAWKYTAPITALGAVLTIAYELPTSGIAYFILFLGVCAIYYVASFLLFNFVEVTRAFDELLDSDSIVEFRQVYSPLHIENITTYLALTTAIGLIAIYAGFRGTLTTGFKFQNDMWRVFLSVPIILFLPGTLFYNYYPRYVLRKLLQHKVFRTMERLGAADADDPTARKLVLDLKEAVALNSQILPFLDYKSLPAYLLAIGFGLSLAYQNDGVVKQFVDFLTHLGLP
jgi:hypothetical protein